MNVRIWAIFQRSCANVPVYVWVNIEVGVPPGGLAVWHCCATHSSFQTTSTGITTAVTDIYSTASQVLTSHVTKPQTHIFISCCDPWNYFIYMFSYIHASLLFFVPSPTRIWKPHSSSVFWLNIQGWVCIFLHFKKKVKTQHVYVLFFLFNSHQMMRYIL